VFSETKQGEVLNFQKGNAVLGKFLLTSMYQNIHEEDSATNEMLLHSKFHYSLKRKLLKHIQYMFFMAHVF
jgi:hypothetical protein